MNSGETRIHLILIRDFELISLKLYYFIHLIMFEKEYLQSSQVCFEYCQMEVYKTWRAC